MRLLARREHSVHELTLKLSSKGFAGSDITPVLQGLCAEGLLSDERFTEAYTDMRKGRGYGPLRIQVELQQRGISKELMLQYIDSPEHDWREQAQWVREKKFGKALPQDYRERVRQMQFLQYRGFSSDHFRAVFGDEE